MAVTGFVFGMVLLCALGVGMAAAGIIWLVVQRKSRQAKERKGRLVLPILLLIMGLLCAGLLFCSHLPCERRARAIARRVGDGD